MKKARVIVTYKCPRHCENCCNEHIGDVPQVVFNDLLKYDELIITGGEPMLIAPRVVEMIHRLRENGFTGKIWLYTSSLKVERWADKEVLNAVDGITYTLHYKPSQIDFRDVRTLNTYIRDNLDNRKNDRSDRLLIDSRCYSDDVLTIVGMATENFRKHWTSVKPLEWRNEACPIPDGEGLVFYDLEKE